LETVSSEERRGSDGRRKQKVVSFELDPTAGVEVVVKTNGFRTLPVYWPTTYFLP